MPTAEQLREIAWEMGEYYPIPALDPHLALHGVAPMQAHAHWRLPAEQLLKYREEHPHLQHAPLILRVYDVTEIIFDGFNAHSFFDIEVHDLDGHYYFSAPRGNRDYLAEIGLRAPDGSYHDLARSHPAYVESGRASGNFRLDGLFVSAALKRSFPVENVFDAPIYEKMHTALLAANPPEHLHVGLLFLGPNRQAGPNSPLGAAIGQLPAKLKKFGCELSLFTPVVERDPHELDEQHLIDEVEALSARAVKEVSRAAKKTPLDLLHCHDWYSARAGREIAEKLNIPLLLSLHSTEHERSHGYTAHSLSAEIRRREQEATQYADLILVPHSSTRQQVINLYGAPEDKVVIVPDVYHREDQAGMDPARARQWLGIAEDAPIILFAGEIAHATGADLLMEAVSHVCARHGSAVFVFVGEGPLKGELEGRAGHSGLGHRCRFPGEVGGETFESLLLISEFVVIPARTWQDETLAQMALERGKPVMTTHQAGIGCVVHGQNGLVTYDNPGSIIWGVQEMLANPLQATMQRLAARQRAGEGVSLEGVAAQYYLYYVIHRQQAGQAR